MTAHRNRNTHGVILLKNVNNDSWTKLIGGIFLQQAVQYDVLQNTLYQDAKKLAGQFMSSRAGHYIRDADSDEEKWSDLSLQVKMFRGTVAIHWRKRQWYKSTKENKRVMITHHLKRVGTGKSYVKALKIAAKPWEQEEVFTLEETFEKIRATSSELSRAKKNLTRFAAKIGQTIPKEFIQDSETETAHITLERVSNLAMLLHGKLWPNARQEDMDVGFVPIIDEQSGVSRQVDSAAANAAIRELVASIHKLSGILYQNTSA
ncbi:conserved protein of unknown function [Acidithiobacillus ferrivorans]|uniref:Uncharacterized protein n=1 Tax=Acidithiobacillus ferrivorans TaxID=160808 RepID=A0A060URH9_9PROT|nr:conserved hypothetical protein [Acidithiobacillus ferrivorans]SMH64848.1 conserved protein of unknown function [Acidithiobacillus ferrivorans]